jgi:hypothetical protein
MPDDAGDRMTKHTEANVTMNPLLTLNQHGQSVWLDNVSRGLRTSPGSM